MNGRLARDVVKRETAVIFEDDIRGDLFIDDPLKNCFFGHAILTISAGNAVLIIQVGESRLSEIASSRSSNGIPCTTG